MSEIMNEKNLEKAAGGAADGKNVCLNCGKVITTAEVAKYDGCCSEACKKAFWKN